MKKILIGFVFSISLLFANEPVFVSILKNVSIPDVNNAIKDAKNLGNDVSKKNFVKFLEDWKKVEALYFAGDINEDYIDTPRYIDVFHNLKENLSVQMKRVIDSKDEPKIALFKNSFKTINALEYILYNDEKITKREKLLVKEISKSIVSHLEDIKNIYEEYIKNRSKKEQWENAVMLNTLIASTYRLKEWRIGDASGNSTKYKNKPKNERAEYFLSKNSFNAIKAILQAHEEIIGIQKYKNFGTMAIEGGAKKQVLEAQNAIKNVLKQIDKIEKTDDFSNAKALYEASRQLHNAYYLSLIEELTIAAKILDADGD